MIQARLNKKRAAPVWATIGVPLVAVPLLVALLAWTAPTGQGGVEEAGIEASATVEAVTVKMGYDCGEVARQLHRS